jgi:hypothetical protein
MRWRFADPNNQAEAESRREVISQIESWWDAFAGKTEALSGLFSRKARWDLPAWMEANLQVIHPSLMWEFGPAVRERGHRLVITPESAHHLRPLVGAILDRAPKIAGWEFYPFRLPESEEHALATVRGRADYDAGDFKVHVAAGEHQRIDLCFQSPEVSGPDDQDALNAAFVAAETLLGEELLDGWVGAVDVESAEDGHGAGSARRPRPVSLDRLRETVVAVMNAMRDQLPDRPLYRRLEGAEWRLWKLDPGESADPFEQQDLFVARSVDPGVWLAAHSGHLFFSERFSRHGEMFCYLKIDGALGLEGTNFDDKSAIEDALDQVLVPAGLGCVMGGGTGTRYSYVDLALLNLDEAVRAIRSVLQEGRLSRNAWIQFFDSNLGAEWIGVHDDSPAPPIRFED